MQKEGSEIDLGGMLRSEPTLVAPQGCPTEIFEVAPLPVERHEPFAKPISHRAPSPQADRAFEPALTPGPPRRSW
ncbi:hypothetical protein [Streptomyces sp. NPDC020362]|uniref:hypothetical protein n=1 Tax=unclassified Streptomyces TaxID=2593676 RepID=UPI000A5E4058